MGGCFHMETFLTGYASDRRDLMLETSQSLSILQPEGFL